MQIAFPYCLTVLNPCYCKALRIAAYVEIGAQNTKSSLGPIIGSGN